MKKMKGIDIFCASQASTAICMSMMDQPSSSSTSSSPPSSSIIHEQLGGRTIDRHNPIIRDARRISTSARITLPSAPCSSEPPINPVPYHQLQKSSKKKKGHSWSKENHDHQKRKSTSSSRAKPVEVANDNNDDKLKKSIVSAPSDAVVRRSWMAKPASDLFTPPGSSRYLLSDSAEYFDGLSDHHHDQVLTLVPFGNKNNQTSVLNQGHDQATATKDRDSSSANSESKPPSDSNQVCFGFLF